MTNNPTRRRRSYVAELPDAAQHSQGVQPRAERLFRGQRRISRAQLSHERRFPRVGRLRRVQAGAVLGEEDEKGPGRGFQKRLEGNASRYYMHINLRYKRTGPNSKQSTT